MDRRLDAPAVDAAMSAPSANVLSRRRELVGLMAAGPEVPSVEALLGRTRRQLYRHARRLGLTQLSRLSKEALASRLHEAMQEAKATAPDAAPVEREHIPLGYAVDRVTAMVVDPERLYVYWEVTDQAIERARPVLGRGGLDAWLVLRVYDVTGRIFDGTNAHSHFDQAIARDDRQWFFVIGKPASTALVEVGLRSHEGSFVRIARSGRADFPRREPVSAGSVEWLTVRAVTGDVMQSVTEGRPPIAPVPGEPVRHVDPVRVWDMRRTHAVQQGELIVHDESFGTAWVQFRWSEEGRIDWAGDLTRASWEAGPFSCPVALPAHVEERLIGGISVRSIDDRTHVVFGPWHVVIHGLGARAERKVLGIWELRRSWVTNADVVAETLTALPPRLGASEHRRGASERRWHGGSELRLRGGSELFMRGASELRYRGASETLYAGASESRFRGASELRFRGASEQRVRGASEQRFRGASEWRHIGASEQRFLGASESRRGGASERMHQGASDRWPSRR